MNLNLDELSLEEIKNGYTYDSHTERYQCLLCGSIYSVGEIFQFDGRFFEASRAIRIHMEQKHGNMLPFLIDSDSKYNTITDKQKELLRFLQEGLSDQEIALKLSISASTVRHQKFSFREKAKQAKMYLAIYELALERTATSDKDSIVPIHDGAVMVDDRYITTKEESDKIISTVFESLSPLKLKLFSAKEKKKIVTLRKIAEQFEKGKTYTEKEINQILKEIYSDYPTLRRYLIQYGFMERSKDCTQYRLK
ncbi:DUF2087 domain-containing protein [Mobilitalea sibirica]|uniref:DUF2087 domain-containing protein n=1 Tax=Mobilitalea sibirica TaxID=1462919 RepID=A0A8J7H6Z9_9FIRM|nr:DUF2087 domain-containing protein [Mobilitalea sibirica]MBH1940831.1 DUF2087 domain-containing protein [Mobilitalea sibirica]